MSQSVSPTDPTSPRSFNTPISFADHSFLATYNDAPVASPRHILPTISLPPSRSHLTLAPSVPGMSLPALAYRSALNRKDDGDDRLGNGPGIDSGINLQSSPLFTQQDHNTHTLGIDCNSNLPAETPTPYRLNLTIQRKRWSAWYLDANTQTEPASHADLRDGQDVDGSDFDSPLLQGPCTAVGDLIDLNDDTDGIQPTETERSSTHPTSSLLAGEGSCEKVETGELVEDVMPAITAYIGSIRRHMKVEEVEVAARSGQLPPWLEQPRPASTPVHHWKGHPAHGSRSQSVEIALDDNLFASLVSASPSKSLVSIGKRLPCETPALLPRRDLGPLDVMKLKALLDVPKALYDPSEDHGSGTPPTTGPAKTVRRTALQVWPALVVRPLSKREDQRLEAVEHLLAALATTLPSESRYEFSCQMRTIVRLAAAFDVHPCDFGVQREGKAPLTLGDLRMSKADEGPADGAARTITIDPIKVQTATANRWIFHSNSASARMNDLFTDLVQSLAWRRAIDAVAEGNRDADLVKLTSLVPLSGANTLHPPTPPSTDTSETSVDSAVSPIGLLRQSEPLFINESRSCPEIFTQGAPLKYGKRVVPRSLAVGRVVTPVTQESIWIALLSAANRARVVLETVFGPEPATLPLKVRMSDIAARVQEGEDQHRVGSPAPIPALKTALALPSRPVLVTSPPLQTKKQRQRANKRLREQALLVKPPAVAIATRKDGMIIVQHQNQSSKKNSTDVKVKQVPPRAPLAMQGKPSSLAHLDNSHGLGHGDEGGAEAKGGKATKQQQQQQRRRQEDQSVEVAGASETMDVKSLGSGGDEAASSDYDTAAEEEEEEEDSSCTYELQ